MVVQQNLSESLVNQNGTNEEKNIAGHLFNNDSRVKLSINGIERINSKFQSASNDGRLAFISYIPNGFPDHATFVAALFALEKAGSDIIEVGVPFSDPIAGNSALRE